MWWEKKKFELTGGSLNLDPNAKKFKILFYVYSKIIGGEFFIITLFFAYLYYTSQLLDASTIPDLVSVQHLKEVIFIQNSTTGSIVSLENFSLLLSVISIFIIYFYFFNILSKHKRGNKPSEHHEKYLSVFFSTVIIMLFVAFLVLGADFSSTAIDPSRIAKDCALWLFGSINIAIAFIFPKYFLPNYKKYEFIDSLRKMPTTVSDEMTSDFIFLSTLLLAVLAYFLNFNLVLVIYVICILLVNHNWCSQVRLLPKEMMNIEFHEGKSSIINEMSNVFIIGKTSHDCFIVLDKENNISYVMKNAVVRIIPQK